MLKIVIPEREFFDENAIDKDNPHGKFVYSKPQELTLEHSLISISKWESKWHKPFLDEKHQKTDEEFIDYVRCMCLTNVPDDAFENISEKNKADILFPAESPKAGLPREKRTYILVFFRKQMKVVD